MRDIGWLFLLVLFAGAALAKPAGPLAVGFGQAPVGKTPAGFTAALTGGAPAGTCVVQADASAPGGRALVQAGPQDVDDGAYPLCVYGGFGARDVEATVRFKPVSGRVDQAGGLAVRYRDADNYYIARANALEGNVRFYKVVRGQRQQLAGVSVKVTSGRWHTLRLSAMGNHFQVAFDGKHLFSAEDDTFKAAGKVALWTKADSVTHYADLRLRSFDKR